MKNIILISFLTFSALVQASECDKFNLDVSQIEDAKYIESMPEAILSHYQQAKAVNFDVTGDFALFKKAASTPKKIWWTLKNDQKNSLNFTSKIESGKNCAIEIFAKIYEQQDQEVIQLPNTIRAVDLEIIYNNNNLTADEKIALAAKIQASHFYLEGHKNPFKTNNFVDMVNQIILEEKANGIEPKYGTPHDWSPEFKNSKLAKNSIMAKFSKLLLALSRGETSQFMLTGTEKQLETWILAQEINSITPHEMIRQSYILNNGDMYSTLLTIENVLNRYWRHTERANLPVTIRLKSIINSFGSDGDKFGSWYHLFGVMLYGYVEGSVPAKTIGTIETIGSHILAKFEDERQEDFVNSKGGVIGGRIARSIKNQKYNSLKFDSNRLDLNYYLDLSEDFSDRLK